VSAGSETRAEHGPVRRDAESAERPVSVTLVPDRASARRDLRAASSLSPASVALVSNKLTPTTGLPGACSSRLTLPPSFSTKATALSTTSSARAALARQIENQDEPFFARGVVRVVWVKGWPGIAGWNEVRLYGEAFGRGK
jgi:hypothetical protein